MDFGALCPLIDDVLLRLQAHYRQVPGLILTESDLKCVLYKELSALPCLGVPTRTYDSLLAVPVHTEVAWFDEQGQLTITSDLAILDPRFLRLLERPCTPEQVTLVRRRGALLREQTTYNWQPLPNKQYEFGGSVINFELKFARTVGDRVFKDVQKDYAKIKRLESVLEGRGSQDEVYHYIVIFSKYRNRSDIFAEWINQCNQEEPHISVVWCSTDMWFPAYKRRGQAH